MNDQFLEELLDELLTNRITPEAAKVFISLIDAPESRARLEAIMEARFLNDQYEIPADLPRQEAIKKLLLEKISKPKSRTIKMFTRYAAAAAVLFAVVGTYFLVFHKNENQVVSFSDIKAPATNRATITLSNGKTVYLDSAVKGTLVSEGNVQVSKLGDGQIVYKGAATQLTYNTLTNPKGSKVIDMILSDGSHVWLNAGSSVTFPIAFIGNERKVSVSGEAYFEVAHNPVRPFVVSKGDTKVTVLGTHFNVNAYDDENDIKVTLLEGSVNINKGSKNELLKPGQQAEIKEVINIKTDIDVEGVMAWKNGLFHFENADLTTVMRQLARWYDVTVKFEGAIPKGTFEGEIGRTLTLSQVLDALAQTRVHFTIEDKTIVIMP